MTHSNLSDESLKPFLSSNFYYISSMMHLVRSLVPFFNGFLLLFCLPAVSVPFHSTTFWYIFTQMSSSSKLRLATSSSYVKNSFFFQYLGLYQCFLIWNQYNWILTFQNNSVNACISTTVWNYFFPSNASLSNIHDFNFQCQE